MYSVGIVILRAVIEGVGDQSFFCRKCLAARLSWVDFCPVIQRCFRIDLFDFFA